MTQPVTCSLCFLRLLGYFIPFLITVTSVTSKRVINSKKKIKNFLCYPNAIYVSWYSICMIYMWYIYAIKNKKKLGFGRFFQWRLCHLWHSSRKLSFGLEFLKSLSSASQASVTSSITSFFSSDKLYHFRLPLNYLPVSPPKLSLPSFSNGIVPFYGAF